jgi:pyridoxamine 5'-phosphate oxidase
LADRAILEQRLAEMERRFPDDIPRPEYWSGYRVLPDSFEFWQEMPFRLHDRSLYQRGSDGAWVATKLFP